MNTKPDFRKWSSSHNNASPELLRNLEEGRQSGIKEGYISASEVRKHFKLKTTLSYLPKEVRP